MPRPLTAVLFDLDGVIVDTARLHFAAWKRLAENLSLAFDEERNHALKGVDRMASLELLIGAAAGNYSDADKQRLAERKNAWYVQSLETLGAADLLPGAESALAQVRGAGLAVALASASRNAAAIVDRLGIADRFDAIVDPSRVARGKPAPDLFLAAAQHLGVRPETCLGVEDAAAGIAALRAAGMASIGVGRREQLNDADWVVADLTQFHLTHYRSAS